MNLDLDGPAVSWGLTFKLANASACCQACKEHVPKGGDPGPCNSWVYCPLRADEECWSPDVWNHTGGECWLKVQEDVLAPKINIRGCRAPRPLPRAPRPPCSWSPRRVRVAHV